MEYNLEEYNKRITEINKEAELRKLVVIREFAQENSPYKIGDKVTDHIGTVLIDKITYNTEYSSGFPRCIYYGLELKKDGTPRKDMSRRAVYQSNIK